MERKMKIPEHLIPPKPKNGQLVFDSDTKKVWIYDQFSDQWIDFNSFLESVTEATKQIAESFKEMAEAAKRVVRSRMVQNDSETKN